VSPKDEIRRLLNEVEQYAHDLELDVEELLDPETIAQVTAIEPTRVAALLHGADPEEPPEGPTKAREEFARRLFVTRIQYLHAHRCLRQTRSGLKKASLIAIARSTLISKAMVGQLLNGDRGPNNDHARRLERFFGVGPGFTSMTEGQALVDYLRRILDNDLPRLALVDFHRRAGVTTVSARSTEQLPAGDVILALVPALRAALTVVEAHRESAKDDDRQ
jgi:transcriptional regulator with XRE-family HTH domain